MNYYVKQLSIVDAPIVIAWVQRLLTELGEEGDDLGELDTARVLSHWEARTDGIFTLAAFTGEDEMIGLATMVESFAIYANGPYGIINEMFVAPEYRSAEIGRLLIREICEIGRQRRWSRIDVTAPESDRWVRTRRFYERQGFTFTGPKLKLRL